MSAMGDFSNLDISLDKNKSGIINAEFLKYKKEGFWNAFIQKKARCKRFKNSLGLLAAGVLLTN